MSILARIASLIGGIVTLGARIREERRRLGKTQTEFAAFAGASRRAMANWEADGAAPLASALMAWSQAGADPYYMLTGKRLVGAPTFSDQMYRDELDEIERALLSPDRRRLPNETLEQAEARVLKSASEVLEEMMAMNAPSDFDPELIVRAKALLSATKDRKTLSLLRASDVIKSRAKRDDERENIRSYFENTSYEPRYSVVDLIARTVIEYGVSRKVLVEIALEVYDDIEEQRLIKLHSAGLSEKGG